MYWGQFSTDLPLYAFIEGMQLTSGFSGESRLTSGVAAHTLTSVSVRYELRNDVPLVHASRKSLMF
jgi:hypothetical protein